MNRLCDVLTYDAQQPMIFSSGLFLFLFLGFSLVYLLLKKTTTLRLLFVVLFSYYFYYKSSGTYFFLLAVVTLSDFTLARLMERTERKGARRALLITSLCINLGLLCYFKYTNFFYEMLAPLWGGQFHALDIFLPVGISFFTFQSLSYTLDVYRGELKALRNPLDYAFFVSFFPQLVAGPIVRARDFIPQIRRPVVVTPEMFGRGVYFIAAGLFKKAILSDYISVNFVERIFDNPGLYSGIENLFGVYGYALQIYCDFSGYSDMAIGIALLLGFRFPKNFDAPYKSATITEFWRRWHISLSTWFKEYLYIPLGGNREGTLKTYRNLMIVFFLTGLWHGASWNFVIWGLFHGTFLVLERIFPIEKILHFRLLKSIYTLLVVIVAWVFFRAETLGSAWAYLNRMFVPYDMESYSKYLSNEFVYVAVLALASCGFGAMLYRRLFALIGRENWGNAVVRAVNPAFCAVIAYFSVLLLASNTYNPFIYFRF